MKISICIPTFNRHDFLSELLNELIIQIESLNFQKDIEIIVSDNHSFDQTEYLLSQLKTNYGYICKISNEENMGPSINIVKSVKNAKGDYIWFLSDDDLPTKDCLQHLIELLNQPVKPNAIVLNWKFFKNINDKNQILNNYGNGIKIKKNAFFSIDDFLKLTLHSCTFMSSIIVKRELIIDSANYWPLTRSLFPHFELLVKAANYTNQIYIVSQPLVMARIGNASYSINEDLWSGLSVLYRDLEYSGLNSTIVKYVLNKIAWEVCFISMRNGTINREQSKSNIKVLKVYFAEYYLQYWVAMFFKLVPKSMLIFLYRFWKNLEKRNTMGGI